MAKQIVKVVKAMARGGQANPAPPLGPALGQAGVDINAFCTQFNDRTKAQQGQMIPVVISVYDDRSFDFVCKKPPAASLIMEVANIKKGSGEPNKTKVATVQWNKMLEIAEIKMPDLNTNDVNMAAKILAGTARNMGVVVEGMPAELEK